ncbi:hypothetical protein ATCC90586_009832 [Pythium insidiosum]|nr:hypothetical protein ATCC90586_009832 [Pythium insidiosum]
MRIVKATAKTAKNGESNRDFDALYNTLMRSPFCASCSSDDNGYERCVRAHKVSIAKRRDIGGRGMDCTIEYTVQLDYNENGRDTPSEMKGKLPEWAKASKKPPHGTRGSRAVYLEDDFICYNRYRPFTMSLDITLQPTTNENCRPPNLAPTTNENCRPPNLAVMQKNMLHLFSIEEDSIKTSHVFAYYTRAPSATSLVTLFALATAKHKDWTTDKRMCYAETGNIGDFTSVKFTFDFYQAFLMYEAKGGGWGSVDLAGQWDGWSMAEVTQPIGKLEHWKDGCLEFSFVYGNGKGHCGYFQYVYPDDELSPADAMPLKLGPPTTNAAFEQPVLNMVAGVIVFPTLNNVCIDVNFQLSAVGPNCLGIRVKYI